MTYKEEMMRADQNRVIEWMYTASEVYADPFNEVSFSALITDPDGEEKRVPGFWGGGNTWRIRYSSPIVGRHTFQTVCSNENDSGLHGNQGEITIAPYHGSNELLRHGPLRKHSSARYLEHIDGTPFYWLGDTWWMGFTTRLRWPEGFQILTDDRVRKGFSVIQIVAGLYPDMDWYDERGANEAGFPWDKEFTGINPEYFDLADMKIAWLVHSGLVPCIVACWGYFLQKAGKEVIKKHWEYLIARYAAYPVVWCLAGEATMPYYLYTEFKSGEGRVEYVKRLRAGWTEIARHVRSEDPFHRPVTIHPTKNGRDQVDDPMLLDLDMLQTGHGSFFSLAPTIETVQRAVGRKPRLPVINSEVCYEGISGSSGADVQRFLYWSCALSGTCGHTYGANGIWQLNSREIPYGPSPHGATWGDTPWEEAFKLPGSYHVGIGAKLMRRYCWWEFQKHPEWLEKHSTQYNPIAPFAAGISGEVRIIFLPILNNFGWGETTVLGLEQGVTYRAFFYDPLTGEEHDQGTVSGEIDGSWTSGKIHIFQDWVLVLERKHDS